MTEEVKKALLTLKAAGWRPFVASGGMPTSGLMPIDPSPFTGFKPYSPDELKAVKQLSKAGWETRWDSHMESGGFRSKVLAPLDRSHEELFR